MALRDRKERHSRRCYRRNPLEQFANSHSLATCLARLRKASFAAKHFLAFSLQSTMMSARCQRMETDFVYQDGDAFLVHVDLNVYGIAPVLKTAYLFTNRCYTHLQYRSEQMVEVRFWSKPGNPTPVDRLAREFCNELLDQTLRAQIAKETERERNLILAHALSRHPVLNRELEATPEFADPRMTAVPDLKKESEDDRT